MRNLIILLFISFFIFPTFFMEKSQAQLNNDLLIEDNFMNYVYAWQDDRIEKIIKDEFKGREGAYAQDTMSIGDLKTFWRFSGSDKEAEFVISGTKASKYLNYGVFWPTGENILLPRNPLTAVSLDKVDKKLTLFWLVKHGEDLDLIYLPTAITVDTLDLPREIEISVF